MPLEAHSGEAHSSFPPKKQQQPKTARTVQRPHCKLAMVVDAIVPVVRASGCDRGRVYRGPGAVGVALAAERVRGDGGGRGLGRRGLKREAEIGSQASDFKHQTDQSAPGQHGHYGEHPTRRVQGW